MRTISKKIILLLNIFFAGNFAAYGAESNSEITVVGLNLGSYGDYLGLRNPKYKEEIDKNALYDERGFLLEEFFLNLRKQIDPDLLILQEAYGFDPKTEKRKNGILDLLHKLKGKGYKLIEDLGEGFIRSGDAIILVKKQKFKILGILPLHKSTLVHLQLRKDPSKKFLVASAHLAGFDITGEDKSAAAGDGRTQLLELLKIMEDERYFDCLKIIGLDANSPPFGTKYIDINGKEFIIRSDRTSLLTSIGYESGYEIQTKTGLPSPTAINASVSEGVRLDYIFAKAPMKHSVKLKEDEESQKKVAPYQLKTDEQSPLVTKSKKGPHHIPFSDHLPVISRISVKPLVQK